ncbi:MAG: hypothetical protein MI861_10220 [Pirellulales bacterium]|nr:hypothetical protein [Pirellulales bacterium]
MVNINPNAASIVAGTARAAARGGEADNQAAQASNRQAVSESPGGKDSESNALDAGDQTGDRGGDGRQTLDVFEKSESSDSEDQQSEATEDSGGSASNDGSGSHDGTDSNDGAGGHLDLQA